VQGNEVWSADSDAVVRRIELETGKVLQTYRGHGGPVTTLALIPSPNNGGESPYLASGSWDKSIKVWNTEDASLLSTTPNAHSDFLKKIVYASALKVLVSAGSDKVGRVRD